LRLQVFLSRSGVSSRRHAADVIRSGKVSVNSKKCLAPSFKVDPEKDKVFLENERILPRENIYLMLHKPRGVTTTKRDPHAAMTVMDLLPRRFRHLNPVGRLDKDTTGLLLLTNDGGLINRLTHPRFNIEKVYRVGLDKRPGPADIKRLEKGIDLDGKHTAPCRIKMGPKNDLEITLREGRKRQIKRMFAALGYRVLDLKRISEGFLDLGRLQQGKWRSLTREEALMLQR